MRNSFLFALALVFAVLCASCNLELAEAPTMSRQGEVVASGDTVEIYTSVKNGVIRYTIDGTDPTFESTLYESAINIVKNTILKAAAFKKDKMVSAISTVEYQVKASVPTPDLDATTTYTIQDSKTVKLSTTTTGGVIHYTTDGNDPKPSSPVYSTPIPVDHNMTVKAITTHPDYADSDMMSVTYGVKAATPTADAAAGTYDNGKQVALSCTTSGVSIYYTTDGTTPTSSSTKYTDPISLTKGITLKAIAIDDDYVSSDVLSVSYSVKLPTPTSNVASGTYGTTQTLTLSAATTGATIYYTLDGTTPTTSSSVYSSSISLPNAIVPATKTLKMFAVASDCLDSDVATYTYTLYTAGPAGGYVFYDCDADNDATNDGAGPDKLKSTTCGWRYLEAAPTDITDGTTQGFIFGWYRLSSSGNNLYVNGASYVEGTADPDDGKSTGTAIGTGKANTTKLVSKMESSAYSSSSGTDTTSNYAAKLCEDYTYGGYSDWFLPSKDELNLMYMNLFVHQFGGFVSDYYWSSSEYYNYALYAWSHGFNDGGQYGGFLYYRYSLYRVRAVRAFLAI